MRNIFLRLILLCSLLLFSISAFTQHKKNYLFARFGKVNGLAADMAFCVAQDLQGYIWIGTDRGLQRYDGKKFLTFRNDKTNAASIPSNAISALKIDKKGRLWVINSNKQVGFMHTGTFRYTPVKIEVPEAFKKNNMLPLIEDHDGTLHISIQGYGVITYNESTKEFSAAYNRIIPVDGSIAQEIHAGSKKGEYLVTTLHGFDQYNSLTKKWAPRNSSIFLSNMNKVLIEENAMGPAHVFTDKKGRTWADMWLDGKKGQGPQVFCYDPTANLFTGFKQSIGMAAMGYHSINGLLEQQDGSIWLYGTNLFARFNESRQMFEDVRNETLKVNGIDLENIFQLYEDKDANIWIPSSNGLFMFNPGRQVFSNLPNKRNDIKPKEYKNSTDAILQSKSGIIYSSAWGGGIFAYDSNFNVVQNPIIPVAAHNDGISGWDMHERSNGEIWIGMQGGSIRVYLPGTKKTAEIKTSAFDNKTVRQVIEDSSGNMWMGTQYGRVIKCTRANWRDTGSFKVMLDVKGRVTKMMTDKKGFVWVCTDRYGLFKLNAGDGSIAEHYDEEAPPGRRLLTAGANDIFQYNDSILLIASGDLNILNIKKNTITYAGVGFGPEHPNLTSILKDRLGYIWLAFSDGLGRIEFGNPIHLYFGSEDGILNNQFQINASALLKDGRIVLGTNTGLLLFDPAKINLPKKAVPVIISGFQLGNRDLLVDSLLKGKEITLPYFNNTFTVDLTTFSYHNDFAVMYMLEGVDEKWIFSNTQKVTYHRLPPGKYIFKAKSVSATGDESDTITTVIIDIVPPFWKTWWFYGLLIISGLVIFYLADRERLLRLKATQKLRTDIALSLHHDVNTALNNINLMSEMARMKADKDIARSKELIGQISEKSNDMIIAMDDMLWVIDPANDSMEKTILRMNEFIDALRNRHEADIVVTIDEKVKHLKPDMKLRHGFFIIFKDALRCLVQYSGAKQTLVNIDLQKTILSLTMKSSATIDPRDTNIKRHLEEMKTHAGSMHAELDIQNDKTACNIILIIPVK
ncbi:MAG: triple tyrosine motif-containing protein [Ferruginibacter sp.]